MTDDQPTQPLTGYELDNIEGRWSRYVALRDPDSMETSVHDVPDLLAEVGRLRAENGSIFADLLQYSHLHWEDCPLDEEDCYLCGGYERIRANAADRKAAQ